MLIGWGLASTVIAFTVRKAGYVYWSSALLVIPGIVVAQTEHGLLPMAGLIHFLIAGIYPFGLFLQIKVYREKH